MHLQMFHPYVTKQATIDLSLSVSPLAHDITCVSLPYTFSCSVVVMFGYSCVHCDYEATHVHGCKATNRARMLDVICRNEGARSMPCQPHGIGICLKPCFIF